MVKLGGWLVLGVLSTGCGGSEPASSAPDSWRHVDGPLTDQELSVGRFWVKNPTPDNDKHRIGGSLSTRSLTRECHARQEGPCVVTSCEDWPATLETTLNDGGTLSVTVGTDVLDVPLVGNGYSLQAVGKLWSIPTDVSVETSGAAVPAFSASLQAPAGVTVTAPHFFDPWVACDLESQRVPIPRSQSFLVSWSGSQKGTVVVEVSWNTASAPSTKATCSFDAAAGQGAVPAEALRWLPGGLGRVDVRTLDTRVVQAGAHVVHVEVEDATLAPEGYAPNSCAQLQ